MLFAHRDAVASSAGGRWKYFEKKKSQKGIRQQKMFVGNATALLSLEAFLLYSRDGLRKTQNLKVQFQEAALILLLDM